MRRLTKNTHCFTPTTHYAIKSTLHKLSSNIPGTDDDYILLKYDYTNPLTLTAMRTPILCDSPRLPANRVFNGAAFSINANNDCCVGVRSALLRRCALIFGVYNTASTVRKAPSRREDLRRARARAVTFREAAGFMKMGFCVRVRAPAFGART